MVKQLEVDSCRCVKIQRWFLLPLLSLKVSFCFRFTFLDFLDNDFVMLDRCLLRLFDSFCWCGWRHVVCFRFTFSNFYMICFDFYFVMLNRLLIGRVDLWLWLKVGICCDSHFRSIKRFIMISCSLSGLYEDDVESVCWFDCLNRSVDYCWGRKPVVVSNSHFLNFICFLLILWRLLRLSVDVVDSFTDLVFLIVWIGLWLSFKSGLCFCIWSWIHLLVLLSLFYA